MIMPWRQKVKFWQESEKKQGAGSQENKVRNKNISEKQKATGWWLL
jgi:hypothetical protein